MGKKHTNTSETVATMTRKQVATALGISISSVRRLEGDTLHPVTDEQGVRRFDTAAVMALTPQTRTDEPPPPIPDEPPAKLSKGEVAARAFECFEQRQAMSEIVIGLQVEPSVITKLYTQWKTGFGNPRRTLLETLTQKKADGFLQEVPEGTRISVARFVRDEYDGTEGRIEHQEFSPLIGFIADGPVTVQDLRARYGTGKHRISAYDLQARRLRWEIVTQL